MTIGTSIANLGGSVTGSADVSPGVLEEESSAAVAFLLDLIRYRSYSGHEREAASFLLDAFAPLVDNADRVPLSDDLKADPEYSDVLPGLEYGDRFNVRLSLEGQANGGSLLFNTHVDVVPESRGQLRAFDPYVHDGLVRGRGACDAKGQIACLYLALRLLHRLKRRPIARIIIHLVVEEENGGNGTLAMIRSAERADAVVVLEPTEGRIVPSVRGAIWFRVTCEGRAAHSGSTGQAISALRSSIEAMGIIEEFHRSLLARSRGLPLFDALENPMPLTFGRLHAGNWPAATPDDARLEGVLGFLPNATREEVMVGLEREIRAVGSPWLSEHCALHFMYRHDSHVISVDHELVHRARFACQEAGVTPAIAAMPASCDSWFYNNLLGIPTIVYGPGMLGVAHSADEHVSIRDLNNSACVLVSLMTNWSL